jgi:hypothetical protein
MYIGEISNKIQQLFEYAYLDNEGEFKSVTVKVWVKRLTFREASAKAFREQLEAIETDNFKLATVTAPLIADWEFFDDKECKVKSPITAEWLGERPPDFVPQLATCVFAALASVDPKQKPANSELGSEPKENAASQMVN